MITDADIYAHPEEIRLDESQLSQALGVSRTPIREAMTLLEQEGFLRTEPRRGIFIVRKTKKQIIEMIEMWAALESMAARLATVNAIGRGHRGPAHDVRRVPHLDAGRAHRRILGREHRVPPGDHPPVRLAPHGQDDRQPVHPRARDPQDDDLAEATARRARSSTTCSIIEALEKRDTELAERLVRQHSLDLAAHVEKYCDFLD